MNPRAPMVAGIAFAVLYLTAVLVLPALPDPDTGVVRAQALLLAFSALAVVVVLAFARDHLTGPPSHIFAIGASVTVAVLCVAAWFVAGPALRPGQVTVGTARALDDIGAMWLPVATIAHILLAVPILLAANEGRLPSWLGTMAAVFTVEQLIETITIIGPPGSFISPGGPMNQFLGGVLTAAFFVALGVALTPPRPVDAHRAGTGDSSAEDVTTRRRKSTELMALPRLVPPTPADEAGDTTRAAVREFLAEQRAAGTFTPSPDAWLSRWDEAFTLALAERGWLGMTVPVSYGGHGRTFGERFVVTEELLAAGAPVAAHWIADRQIVPSLLKYGTEFQKAEFLPKIARGECFFGIGMSEPDSGSDLASVRTKAQRVDGGWALTGTKVWTSGAHLSHAFIALARTEPVDPAHRHAGLSQFLVDLRGPGVDIRPIVSMNGAHHFNEVILDEVFVPDEMVFGTIGRGWQQVTSELAFERSGPERFLSTFVVLDACAESMAAQRITRSDDLGRLVARIAGLHQMSSAVAGALGRHEPADVAAAVVKVLGTTTEGDIAEFAHLCAGDTAGEDFSGMADAAVDQRPGFTLRGGTNEVLRGVIARGLGIR